MNRALLPLLIVGSTLAAPATYAAAGLPAFAVNERVDPTDALAERETRWDHPGVTLSALTYSTLPGYRPLRLDLYRQTGITAPRPLVVYLHGGGWMFSNPRAGAAFKRFPDILAALAERGYIVAAIEYRLSGEARFPAQSEDVAAALQFLRDNSGRLGIDPARIALWGMSAGAQLGALQAVTCPPGQCVQGFVGWFGVYDLQQHLADAPRESFGRVLLGCVDSPCEPAKVAAASAADQVRLGAPPMLLLHGTADTSVLPVQSRIFAQRLRAAGNSVDLVEIEGAAHAFLGTDTTATQRALQQALSTTFDFFDRVLRPATGR